MSQTVSENAKVKYDEQMVWVGDGINANAKDQVGRRVNINSKTGKVVDASDLYIFIKWDFSFKLKRAVIWYLKYILFFRWYIDFWMLFWTPRYLWKKELYYYRDHD